MITDTVGETSVWDDLSEVFEREEDDTEENFKSGLRRVSLASIVSTCCLRSVRVLYIWLRLFWNRSSFVVTSEGDIGRGDC